MQIVNFNEISGSWTNFVNLCEICLQKYLIQQETYTSILAHVIIVIIKMSCVLVIVFGEVTGSTYSSLEDNTVLISDTTLYCVTENKNTPQVMWTHVNLAGVSTGVTSTTDTSTGVSTIQVYTTQPGYYSCEVTENGGSSRTYTAVMTDTNPDTGEYFIWAQCTGCPKKCWPVYIDRLFALL